MKALILAGGFGTRLSEETDIRPKPMIQIGGQPILWHIMKIYSHHGINDFVILLGYKGYYIKEYFAHYFLHRSDITIDFRNGNERVIHKHSAEPWRITLVDTGAETMTGGRVKRAQEYVGNEPFLLTYGDGVSDINIQALIDFHKKQQTYATLTAVQPSGRFGALALSEEDKVQAFQEKPRGDGSWINGGFFVCQPEVFQYITKGDQTIFERDPLENLAKEGQLSAYKHDGFWQPMDTLRDKVQLEEMWQSGNAPWKVWG
ncbi:glucose-1-phosphate cytidylyltransferase [Chrysiogenes arsenatis]|uniref:glucose-1-phosphate cytidylyltransferase n=1 Tax=Chrysiogenes arsenatis TaxID=309797 RepID=UPI00040E86D8|nr:glucose-1-phosphate cytidylyltransferase [Chrysiogenes arsenatis]